MTLTDTKKRLDYLAGRYQLDPAHTRLGFAVRHMVTTVHGFSGPGVMPAYARARAGSSSPRPTT